MNHDLYNADRSRERTVLALIGAAIVAVSVTPQRAAAQTERWTAREFQTGVFGIDNAVDVAFWKDDQNVEWVYMTGYQTLANGATVFATHKYAADDTGVASWDKRAFYPLLTANPTGTNRAVAIEVDPTNGDVYVTGESIDPAGADGLDYVTIKYDKFLVPDTGWVAAGHQGAVVRWDNPIFAGPGSHDRPVGLSLGTNYQPDPEIPNAIGITGTSYAGPLNGYDNIVTLLLDANTGDTYAPWGLIGTRSFDGSAHGNDSPVDLGLYWWADISQSAAAVLHTVVAGTISSVNSGQINDDIWTIEYDKDGNPLWNDVYNGPANERDVATAMTLMFGNGGSGVFVCGYTLHYDPAQSASSGGGGGGGVSAGAQSGAGGGGGGAPLSFADTDYIALGYALRSIFAPNPDPWFDWPDAGIPNTIGVRVFNGPGPTSVTSDDIARDIAVGEFGEEVWLTGTVREPDGVGYDTATIRYNAFNHPQADPAQTVRVDLPTTSEKAIALAVNDANLPEEIYVTGTIQPGVNDTPLIQTLKIVSGTMTIPVWIRLFGNAISDIPSAIIAPTRHADGSVSVIVFGQSFQFSNAYDQVGVHYTQQP